MNSLIKEVFSLKSSIGKSVKDRVLDFEEIGGKSNDIWFSELCFCILTANSKARTAMAIQEELKAQGFLTKSFETIRDTIIRHKHRFHNNKAKFIVAARENRRIKEVIQTIAQREGEIGARAWLAENIKGIGYKEASHFMRNVGFKNLAILDRHILNLMKEHNIIQDIPKPLSKKSYLEIESLFLALAKEAKMSAAELDLYMWYMKGGDVLK